MAQPATHYMSDEEFFEFLQTRDEKWELVDGQPMMMAGANQRHQAIAANTFASLHVSLRGSACRPTASDTGVSSLGGNVRYPDVVVDCGPREDQAMLATSPSLVIEVLSPSTRSFDSHKKLIEYKANPKIKSILLIDTNEVCALMHRRDNDGWVEIIYSNLTDIIDLPEIGTSLALSDIYDGLEFKPRLVLEAVCESCKATPCICGDIDNSFKR